MSGNDPKANATAASAFTGSTVLSIKSSDGGATSNASDALASN